MRALVDLWLEAVEEKNKACGKERALFIQLCQSRHDSSIKGLTPGEIRVYDLLSNGLTNLEIANKLTCTTRAVKSHASAIYKKLGLKRSELQRRV